ncbi:MAG: hypothetical protein JWM10_4402 [Myxococcaceae bacterium]|nr:hypothetical protein [Myxococcaceae bacterium]
MTPTLRLLLALALACAAACTSDPPATTPTDDASLDAAADDVGSAADVRGPRTDGACEADLDCDDGLYCDGAERCVMGRCAAGTSPCDDRYSCTREVSCDEDTRACRRVPDDSVCGDGNACNGTERCDPSTPGALAGTGCQPVRADDQIDCDDRNTCTIDSCDVRVGCVHSPRDLDGDGYVATSCTTDATPRGAPGTDCNDSDPRVFPGAPEVCDDGRDNNCNLLADFADTTVCRPANDACERAQEIRVGAPATYSVTGSTVGLGSTFAVGCGRAGQPVALYRFTLAAPQDVAVTDDDTAAPVGVIALLSACAPAAELRCARGVSSTAPQLQVRSLAAGTYFLAVQTSTPRIFRLRLTVGRPTTAPASDLCPAPGATAAFDLADGEAHAVSFAGLLPDYSLSCDTGAPSPDAVFPLTIPARRNVTLTVTGPASERVTFAVFRAPCGAAASELRCATALTTTRIVQRPLEAGAYFVVVRSQTGRDVTLQATVTDPTMRTPGDVCPGIAVAPDGPEITLTPPRFEAFPDVGTSCGSNGSTDGWTDMVARFTLTEARDVTVSIAGSGSASLRMQLQSDCAARTSAIGPCVSGVPPVRRYRGLAAGTYYVVVESNAPPPALTLSVTTTAPGARLPGDTCPGVEAAPDGPPGVVSLAGLDTVSDLGTSCGSVRPADAWTDWVFHFRLTAPRDVTLTMLGGTALRMQMFTGCGAGSNSVGGCVTGTSMAERRYRTLPAGDYYVVGEQAGAAGLSGTARLLVATSDPGVRAAGDTCATAAAVLPDGPVVVLPVATFDPVPDHGTPCGSATLSTGTWTDFAATFTLATPRDVTVTLTPTPSAQLFAALERTCGSAASINGACLAGTSGAPWVQRYPSLPAGTYAVLGEARSLSATATVGVAVTTLPAGTMPTYRRTEAPAEAAYVDACAAPGARRALQNVNDAQVSDAVPFPFRYWGAAVSVVNIASNGFINFDGANSAATSGLIPDRAAPNGVIAAYWLDLITRDSGVCIATVGAAPNRRFVVQWDDAAYYPARTGNLSFEIVLNEGTNAIDMLYPSLGAPTANVTLGLESGDGMDGAVLCSASAACPIASGARVRWLPTP